VPGFWQEQQIADRLFTSFSAVGLAGRSQERGGGFRFTDLRAAFFTDCRFAFNLTQRNHPRGAERKVGGALVNPLRETPQARIHAFGKRDLNFQPTIFVRTRDIGSHIAEACEVVEVFGIYALGEKHNAPLQGTLFGHGSVGVRDLGEVHFSQSLVQSLGGFWFWKLDEGEVNFRGGCGNGLEQQNGGEESHAGGSIAPTGNGNEISMAHA